MEPRKRCTSCKKLKIIVDFYPRKSRGLNEWSQPCKQCQKLRCSEWRRKNKYRHSRNHRRWLEQNQNYIRDYKKIARQKLRLEIYNAYGGSICKCCGEKEWSFLTIDHIENDGYKHRKELKSRSSDVLFVWLKKNNFPRGFQVLCMNCQFGKVRNNGRCPHKITKNKNQ